MTPEFKKKTQIDTGLKIIFGDPKFRFREKDAERAKAIYKKWENENWGAPAAVKKEVVVKKEETDDENQSDVVMSDADASESKKRKRSPSTDEVEKTRYLRQPKPDHPIWGVNGIMHGICICKSSDGRKSKVINPRYKSQQRPANHYGHHGLTVGNWFPSQLSALFHGAHGHAQAGIYGTPQAGAYSVVVSGHYDDLDRDHGHKLLYSGSGSKKNKDANHPADPTNATQALHSSMATGNPVRVLRSSKGNTAWSPSDGMRYDGLYTVVRVRYPLNDLGGMYEQFKLVREEDQAPMDTSRPNRQEQRDYDKIDDGYPVDKGD